jgi:hypothetical protein
MHFSTLAALAAAFASVVYAIPAEAAEAVTDGTEATEAITDIQHYYARYITNAATGTFLDLYNGKRCQKGGTPVNGWYVAPISPL